MKYRSTIPAVTLSLVLQAACSNQAVYTGESFAEDSPYKKRFDGDAVLACESARRSLLGQGYLIESAGGEGVKGRKASRSEDAQNTFIEVNVVCVSENTGSTLFASAQVSEYALKKSSSSASVGVSALGSISLPIGQSADSLVKVREETIDDKDFYRRFFTAVGKTMAEMQVDRAVSVPVAETAAPEPIPAPAPKSAPPAVPAALPAAATEAHPAADATAVQDPLPELTKPASLPEPVPERAAPAPGPESNPVQEVPAAIEQEPLPGNVSTVPILGEEASGMPPAQVTPQAYPAASASPTAQKPAETAPESVPEPLPDPLLEELF